LVQESGLSYQAVRKALALELFEQGGWAAIKPVGRGRPKGDVRLLALTRARSPHPKGHL
jgi:hypothetical protein